MSTNRKRRYSKLSLEDKVRLLSDSDNGLSHRSLAAKFRISKGQVTNILKRKKGITFIHNVAIFLSRSVKRLGRSDFRASEGWLGCFKKRHNIKLKVISGEYASVDEGTVNNWKERLFEILKCYEKRNVFNCDETGLLFRTIPNKTLAVKNDKCKGRAPDRIACFQYDWKKLSPLVIGKSEKPRWFKHLKSEDLPAK
ncbi:Tigger transposable element-derived protein 6 [Trichinella zimbabwensis]|uniref:Tigger transposable element-derived protein 6 n=1 Tax=Trichinella zimbabwensis TaxID=268475 RepID=A0A0V1HWW4_9BILA|nr:Tigger transposable element-derived protein 6 [Trichinella zimbabwensis]